MNELEHIKMCMDLGFNLGTGLKMKTLQENIDTIEDCSDDHIPEGHPVMGPYNRHAALTQPTKE